MATDDAPAENPFDPVPEEIVARWLDSLDLSSGTKAAYAHGFMSFCRFVRASALDFDALTRESILSYKQYLIAEKGLRPSTVSSYLAAVRSFFSMAEDDGIENVAKSVHGETSSRDFKKDALTPGEARRLLASVDRSTPGGLRDYAILNLMIRTGLRDVEVVRADCGDIRTSGGATVLDVQGKGRPDKDSFVVLTPEAVEPIRTYLATRRSARANDPLFASLAHRNLGGRLTTRSISRIAKEALRAIGLDDERHTAHSLRHTAITLALLGGASERDAQQMARHASITTTMIYSHNIDRIRNAAEKSVGSVLDGDDA